MIKASRMLNTMVCLSVILCLQCAVIFKAHSAEAQLYPQFSATFDYVYDDYQRAYERMFSEDAVPYWWLVGLSTVALVAVDDKLIQDAENLGDSLGLNRKDNTKTFVQVGDLAILRLPTDLGSGMYFIGDGWTHIAIASSLLAIGAWTDDDRAYRTGFQVIEGMITTSIATQTIKHITGRESPFRATTSTGKWDWFPNQLAYHQNVPKYDAFPSGHVAVSAMTLTVLHKNYPEKTWIMPTGITLIALLSFQMMNNGVHWASDYPLAIALGYTFGSIAYARGQAAVQWGEDSHDLAWLPLISSEGIGLQVSSSF